MNRGGRYQPRARGLLLAVTIMTLHAAAQDTKYVPDGPWNQFMLAAPPCLALKDPWDLDTGICPAGTHEQWLKDVTHWREERKIRIGYDGSRYDDPALRWTQSSFMQPQMMVEDRYFYDPGTGKYTVDRYLDDLEKRYGGIDSVLIWPTYPNMGIDNRNQHDMIRSMPGGIRRGEANGR